MFLQAYHVQREIRAVLRGDVGEVAEDEGAHSLRDHCARDVRVYLQQRREQKDNTRMTQCFKDTRTVESSNETKESELLTSRP